MGINILIHKGKINIPLLEINNNTLKIIIVNNISLKMNLKINKGHLKKKKKSISKPSFFLTCIHLLYN